MITTTVAQTQPDSATTNQAFVDVLINRALAAGARTFLDVVRLAEGAFPTDVAEGLRRRDTSLDHGVTSSWETVLRAARSDDDVGPIPHPLDFDWRFTKGTRHRIAKSVLDVAGRDDHILLLGAPSILPTLRTLDDRLKLSLFDRNADCWLRATGSSCRRMTTEDFNEASTSVADVVVLDPPWYPEYVERFLRAALKVSRPGSLLFLCLPQEGTRPSVAAERQALLLLLKTLGLRVVEKLAGQAQYMAPPFERAVLWTTRTLVPMNWRHGDIWILEVASCKAALGDLISPPFQSELGPNRVRLARHVQPWDNDKPKLLVAGAVHTCSRRTAHRHTAVLWTALNNALLLVDHEADLEAAALTMSVSGVWRVTSNEYCSQHLNSTMGEAVATLTLLDAQYSRIIFGSPWQSPTAHELRLMLCRRTSAAGIEEEVVVSP